MTNIGIFYHILLESRSSISARKRSHSRACLYQEEEKWLDEISRAQETFAKYAPCGGSYNPECLYSEASSWANNGLYADQ
jgi:hypothetical protein